MSGEHLVFERAGKGPPVLLLHGFTGSSASWDEVRRWLAKDMQVVTVDLPGHGRSPAPADPGFYALPRVADAIARALDNMGIERVVVAGYSMGGRLALRLALAHPARCSALVLESTSPGIASPDERAARRRSDAELADLIEREGIEAFVDRWETLPLWASQQSLPPEDRLRQRRIRLSHSPAGLANSLRGAGAGEDPPVLDRLGELTMPVLLLAGALDAPYVEHANAMAARIPDALVHVEPGAGHAVHLERPRRVASIIHRFALASAR